MSVSQSLRLIKMTIMKNKLGQPQSGIYAKMDPQSKSYDPTFPLPVKVSARGVAWLEHEVDEWIQSRPRVGRSDFTADEAGEDQTPGENQSDRVTE